MGNPSKKTTKGTQPPISIIDPATGKPYTGAKLTAYYNTLAALNSTYAFANAPTAGGVTVNASSYTAPVKKGGGTGPSPKPDTTPYKGQFIYNAPMVNDAYFNPLPQMSDNNIYGHTVTSDYTNAQQAWANGKSAKGAFQMDRINANATNMKDLVAANKKNKTFDKNMYGFKFLYNPTTVNMDWGSVQAANPSFMAYGLNKINPIAQSLLSSYISFDIVLNRIQDMNYLTADGLYNWEADPLSNTLDNLSLVTQQYVQAAGGTPNFTGIPSIPYPKDISIEERKSIYNKGTMYDIDWLLKVLHGYDGYRDYNSFLRGKNNDPGWLPVTPVELHLGNNLRYRVRVTSVSVKHSIFNSRMIPVLSTVSFNCARYFDAIDDPTQTKAK